MRGGVAGAISAARKGHKYSVDEENAPNQKVERQNFLQHYQEQMKILNAKKKKLEYANYPVFAWFLGVVLIAGSIYLFVHVSQGQYSDFKSFNQGYWWQYLICALIMFLGICFLFVLRSEIVVFDKERDEVFKLQRNFCFFKRKLITKKLSTLVSIHIVKKGHDSITNKTIHYKIQLHFLESRKVELLETNSRSSIRKTYIEIKTFLGQDIPDIQNIHIIDESTSTYHNRV